MNTTYSALMTLYVRAKDRMSGEELREVGTILTDNASAFARHMQGTCESLACLVSNDAVCKPQAGNFQGGAEVFDLLMVMGATFDVIAGMTEAGKEATALAALRKQQEVRT